MEKKTKFHLIFADGSGGDWCMILITSEPKTDDEVENLIYYYADINSHNNEVFSPVDILDDICADKNWKWEDEEYDSLVITNWK